MMHEPIDPSLHSHPASKWTAEVRIRFLEHLSRKGNVRAACLLVGASTETAYRLRRRDQAFARGWDAAIALARRAAEHVLADRAIDGVVVDIYHRGEWIASQRKYDSRLLLAHLARLDQQVKESAEADAERFDEILAVIIGEPMPADFDNDDEILGKDRERFAEEAAHAARLEAEHRQAVASDGEEETLSDEERWARQDEREADCADAADNARGEARWRWDSWHAELCAAVDAVLDDVGEGEEERSEGPAGPPSEEESEAVAAGPRGDADISPRTASTVSTPAAAQMKEAAPEGGLSDGPTDGPAGGPPASVEDAEREADRAAEEHHRKPEDQR